MNEVMRDINPTWSRFQDDNISGSTLCIDLQFLGTAFWSSTCHTWLIDTEDDTKRTLPTDTSGILFLCQRGEDKRDALTRSLIFTENKLRSQR